MYPWYIHTTIKTDLLLWRLGPKTFRVVKFGNPQVILTNMDYFLIDNKFLTLFNKLNNQVTVMTDIAIVDNVKNTTLHHYFEVKIHNEMNVKDMDQMDTTGLKIWKLGEYLFVSDDVKHELELIDDGELEFSLGFSNFGG